MTAVKPLLVEWKCCLIVSDEIVEKGNKLFVEATATLHDADTTDTLFAKGDAEHPETKKGMDQSQITGSSSSYARKYALNGLFAIDDVKDADATNTHGKRTPKPSDLAMEKAQRQHDAKQAGF